MKQKPSLLKRMACLRLVIWTQNLLSSSPARVLLFILAAGGLGLVIGMLLVLEGVV